MIFFNLIVELKVTVSSGCGVGLDNQKLFLMPSVASVAGWPLIATLLLIVRSGRTCFRSGLIMFFTLCVALPTKSLTLLRTLGMTP